MPEAYETEITNKDLQTVLEAVCSQSRNQARWVWGSVALDQGCREVLLYRNSKGVGLILDSCGEAQFRWFAGRSIWDFKLWGTSSVELPIPQTLMSATREELCCSLCLPGFAWFPTEGETCFEVHCGKYVEPSHQQPSLTCQVRPL